MEMSRLLLPALLLPLLACEAGPDETSATGYERERITGNERERISTSPSESPRQAYERRCGSGGATPEEECARLAESLREAEAAHMEFMLKQGMGSERQGSK